MKFVEESVEVALLCTAFASELSRLVVDIEVSLLEAKGAVTYSILGSPVKEDSEKDVGVAKALGFSLGGRGGGS